MCPSVTVSPVRHRVSLPVSGLSWGRGVPVNKLIDEKHISLGAKIVILCFHATVLLRVSLVKNISKLFKSNSLKIGVCLSDRPSVRQNHIWAKRALLLQPKAAALRRFSGSLVLNVFKFYTFCLDSYEMSAHKNIHT